MQESAQRSAMRARLSTGAQALGSALSDLQLSTLLDYAELMLKWNKVYNLSALREPMEVVDLHLLDCLTLIPAIRALAGDKPGTVMDIGSGAGLPAVVIALLFPQLRVHAVDAVDKKIAFQRQAAAQLRLTNWLAHHVRVEQWACEPTASAKEGARLITARAYASLGQLVKSTRHLATPSTRWLAMKGKIPHDEMSELAELAPDVQVDTIVPIPIPGNESERCLITLSLRPVE